MFGVTPCSEHQRVAWRAGNGQTYLVMPSVTSLYAPLKVAFSAAGTVSGVSGITTGFSRLRSLCR